MILLLALPGRAQGPYGDKGIYPVYEDTGKWLIFDKTAIKKQKKNSGTDRRLQPGAKFLVIGSKGSGLFTISQTTASYGGACAGRMPLRLQAAVLEGARGAVGTPVIGLSVKENYNPKSSKATFTPLANQVGEDTYLRLGSTLRERAARDIRDGVFRFKLEDNPSPEFLDNPPADQIAVRIEFASAVNLRGPASPMVLVERTQALGTYRRCLRLAAGGSLAGDCVEMPHDLRVETALLSFVSYDPKGKGRPYLLGFTSQPPLWGHERWGFALQPGGPKAFLMEAMDVRCREGF